MKQFWKIGIISMDKNQEIFIFKEMENYLYIKMVRMILMDSLDGIMSVVLFLPVQMPM